MNSDSITQRIRKITDRHRGTGQKLVLRGGGRDVPVPDHEYLIIGSAASSDLVVPGVAPLQARLTRRDGGLVIESLARNGLVTINGVPVLDSGDLLLGTEVRVGDLKLEVTDGGTKAKPTSPSGRFALPPAPSLPAGGLGARAEPAPPPRLPRASTIPPAPVVAAGPRCPHADACPLFPVFRARELLAVWTTRYCESTSHASCERFLMACDGTPVPRNLLPNGQRLPLVPGDAALSAKDVLARR